MSVFEGYRSLTEARLGENLRSVGDYAFRDRPSFRHPVYNDTPGIVLRDIVGRTQVHDPLLKIHE